MKNLVRTSAAAAAGAAALTGVLLASAASATSAGRPAGELPATNGTTTITTTPTDARHDEGIGNAMVYDGVMPTAMAPATATLLRAGLLFFNPSGFTSQFRFTLPVVAGALSPHALRGTVRHSGGILFSDRHSLLEITHLVADLKRGTMTGTLTPQVGIPFRPRHLILFRLDLSHARVRPGPTGTRVTGIGLDFSKAAAAALDRILATKIFRAGLEFGTATIAVDNVAGLPASSRS
jgi:hypothetical protein